MILLHHTESELSRALLAALPAGATSIDCTSGIPTDYTGPMAVSAFPSVVVDVPAYSETVPTYDADGGGGAGGGCVVIVTGSSGYTNAGTVRAAGGGNSGWGSNGGAGSVNIFELKKKNKEY